MSPHSLVGAPESLTCQVACQRQTWSRRMCVQQALSLAGSQCNKAGKDTSHSHTTCVMHTLKQVMAELNYLLDVEIGQTTRTKSQPNAVSLPWPAAPEWEITHSFPIGTVPWLGKISRVRSNCGDTARTCDRLGRTGGLRLLFENSATCWRTGVNKRSTHPS